MRLEFPAHGYKSCSERANTRIRQPINRSQVRPNVTTATMHRLLRLYIYTTEHIILGLGERTMVLIALDLRTLVLIYCGASLPRCG